jgi:formylglycine-generating enzyme required for sulfatase activity
VFIPPGEFWFGDIDEKLRTDFLDTVPIHRRSTGSYLIARHETTYRQWIAFLDELPAAQQSAHAPDVASAHKGSLKLGRSGGSWQLTFHPTSQRYTARAQEPFVYVGRTRRAEQPWLDFPVAAISPADVEQFLAWQRRTGKVPGARLCTEAEWERAARGADDRVYPHGDELARDDANFDLTYGRVDSAFGPDAVGSHPASRSPFGLDDLAGNIFEFTQSSLDKGGPVVRGGAYYFNAATCRITNRNSVFATFRDLTTGVRICASFEGTHHVDQAQE